MQNPTTQITFTLGGVLPAGTVEVSCALDEDLDAVECRADEAANSSLYSTNPSISVALPVDLATMANGIIERAHGSDMQKIVAADIHVTWPSGLDASQEISYDEQGAVFKAGGLEIADSITATINAKKEVHDSPDTFL